MSGTGEVGEAQRRTILTIISPGRLVDLLGNEETVYVVAGKPSRSRLSYAVMSSSGISSALPRSHFPVVPAGRIFHTPTACIACRLGAQRRVALKLDLAVPLEGHVFETRPCCAPFIASLRNSTLLHNRRAIFLSVCLPVFFFVIRVLRAVVRRRETWEAMGKIAVSPEFAETIKVPPV